jgi:hypothetical protein
MHRTPRRALPAALAALAVLVLPVAPASAAYSKPVASFTASPTTVVAGKAVKLDGSKSTCKATPCTYKWEDRPPSGGVYAIGSGKTLTYTFKDAGTKYVTLTVTDTRKASASVRHNVVVNADARPAGPDAHADTVDLHGDDHDHGPAAEPGDGRPRRLGAMPGVGQLRRAVDP